MWAAHPSSIRSSRCRVSASWHRAEWSASAARRRTFRHRVASKPEVNAAEPLPDQRAAIQRMISLLCDARVGALADLRELNGIGFKVVGGRGVTGATLLDDQVLAAMEEYVPLLPAHNPPYIAAVRLFRDLLPGVPLVGLFETAFHDGMPTPGISLFGSVRMVRALRCPPSRLSWRILSLRRGAGAGTFGPAAGVPPSGGMSSGRELVGLRHPGRTVRGHEYGHVGPSGHSHGESLRRR